LDNTAKDIKKYTLKEYYIELEHLNYLAELRNGEIVSMGSPNIKHQRLTRKLVVKIDNYITSNGGSCEVFNAPTDVKLNDNNVVIPDVFIVCKPENFDNQKYNGSPDFIIEIVSTNWTDDYIRKLALYQENGVREYWIVDPKSNKVTVYFFEENFVSVYGFTETIPVNIYKYNPIKLEINVSEMLS
jgi:Uma2 family endonuclease